MQQFDFDTQESLDYKFTDLVETSRIELVQNIEKPIA